MVWRDSNPRHPALPDHLHRAKPGSSTTGLQPLSYVRRMVSWQTLAYCDARGKVTRRVRERMFTDCTGINQ